MSPHSWKPVRQVPREQTSAVSVGSDVVVVVVGRHFFPPASDKAVRARRAKAIRHEFLSKDERMKIMVGYGCGGW
jgi:hypothetical protein